MNATTHTLTLAQLAKRDAINSMILDRHTMRAIAMRQLQSRAN